MPRVLQTKVLDFFGCVFKIFFMDYSILFKKINSLWARAAIVPIFLFLLSGCQDVKVKGDYKNPYTTDEVRRMMAYHGAQVARFDGKQWWFLSGRRWVKLENDGAQAYALLNSASSRSHVF